MSYQILARKYRPQTFDDVLGQETVTRTLKNSIHVGRVANAYIFCGPRGVGKTSIARLLSKTLNCEGPPEKAPCNKCVSCLEITKGNNIDVLEIDGASNRGIDEIRALRENVKFSPSKGKFKVYIIDEVHMLTTEAFNALLKTLEEPPAHVKFIFATTEAHKVLPTILSRCQRFDFKQISPKVIFDRIMTVAKKEKIALDEKAALLIARTSEGSLRDALVVLDQMISFSGKQVNYDDVVELLGAVGRDKIMELANAVIECRTDRVTKILDDLINNGKDPVFVTNNLIGYYRDLMILKTAGEPTGDMAFSAEELAELKEQSDKLSLDEILYILQNLSHCLTLMKMAASARAPIEIMLVRLTRRKSILSLPEVLDRLENMDARSDKEENSGSPSEEVAEIEEAREEVPQNETETNSVTSGAVDLATSKVHWSSVMNYVKNKKMSVFTFLSAGKPLEFSDNKIVIGFDAEHAFNKEALETNGRDIVEEAIKKVTGSQPKLEFTVLEFLGKDPEKEEVVPARKAESREKMKPVIEKAMDVFGGHLVQDFTEDNK